MTIPRRAECKQHLGLLKLIKFQCPTVLGTINQNGNITQQNNPIQCHSVSGSISQTIKVGEKKRKSNDFIYFYSVLVWRMVCWSVTEYEQRAHLLWIKYVCKFIKNGGKGEKSPLIFLIKRTNINCLFKYLYRKISKNVNNIFMLLCVMWLTRDGQHQNLFVHMKNTTAFFFSCTKRILQ